MVAFGQCLADLRASNRSRNPSFALLAIDTYRGVPLDIETLIQG